MSRRKSVKVKHKKERLSKRLHKYWFILSNYYKGQDDGKGCRNEARKML